MGHASFQGMNTMLPVQEVLTQLQTAADMHADTGSPPLEALVYHEDLPNNDFSQLLKFILSPEASYLHQPVNRNVDAPADPVNTPVASQATAA